jgi:hypothetical protein
MHRSLRMSHFHGWSRTCVSGRLAELQTKKLAEHKLAVRAGAILTILESVEGASRVHFATDAQTPDYKITIKQYEAIGWTATKHGSP